MLGGHSEDIAREVTAVLAEAARRRCAISLSWQG
jgi:hypothetical protein